MKYLSSIFLLILAPLIVQASDDEILVRLQTESQLLPVYLANVTGSSSGFDKAYLDKLDSVFRFDLGVSAAAQLLPVNGDRESLAKRGLTSPKDTFSQWRGAGVAFVLLPSVNNKQLSVRLLSIQKEGVKEVKDVALAGNIDQDRRVIHRLIDSLHKEMFGVAGVANTRILFTKRLQGKDGKFVSDVWEADYDGANAHQVTHEGYCVTPAYMPPASGNAAGQFFFVSYKTGLPRILYASMKDGEGHRFTTLKGNQLMPNLSRQRDKVAFVCDVAGNPDLFVQAFSPETGPVGKPQQVFHASRSTQGSPSFSPDGKSLAFASDKDGMAKVYTLQIPPAGTDLQNIKATLISKKARNGSAPAWSADGAKIAYCSNTGGTRQIWVYDRTTGEETQITTGSGNKENPSWAPDSLHLVYNTSDTGKCELYLVDIVRHKPTKLPIAGGDKHYPSWEPR